MRRDGKGTSVELLLLGLFELVDGHLCPGFGFSPGCNIGPRRGRAARKDGEESKCAAGRKRAVHKAERLELWWWGGDTLRNH